MKNFLAAQKTCHVCQSFIFSEDFICRGCRHDILNEPLVFREIHQLPIISLFNYVAPVSEFVQLCKGGRNPAMIQSLGQLMAERFSSICLKSVEGVIPMPAKEKGAHDHAYLLSETVARYFHVPVAGHFLQRRMSEGQEAQKNQNLSRRMEVKMDLASDFKPFEDLGLWILVDDVVTSGSTMLEAWITLGRPDAVGLTLASTPHKNSFLNRDL